MINWKHVSDIVAVIVIVGCATAVSVMWYHGWFARKPADEQPKNAVVQAPYLDLGKERRSIQRVEQKKVPERESSQAKAVKSREMPRAGKLPPGNKKPTYSRVLPGGKVDGPVDCKRVETFRNIPYSTVQEYAGQYGVPASVVQRYRVCFQ